MKRLLGWKAVPAVCALAFLTASAALRALADEGQSQPKSKDETQSVVVYDVLDKNNVSVKGKVLDVKTQAPPVTIRFRIVGAPNRLTLKTAKVRIRYDGASEPHGFLYAPLTTNRIVWEETDVTKMTRVPNTVNDFLLTTWKGRDNKTGANRLLLGGNFTIKVEGITTNVPNATYAYSEYVQEIAKPRAGHYCSDWPRASVYDLGALSTSKWRIESDPTTVPDDNSEDNIQPMLKNVFDSPSDGDWRFLDTTFRYKVNFTGAGVGRWIAYTTGFPPAGVPAPRPMRMSVSAIHEAATGASGRYPSAVRRGIMAQWKANQSKWQMYWADDPFDTGTWTEYYTMSGTTRQNVYMTTGGSVDLAFDGSRDGDGKQVRDFTLTSVAGERTPNDGDRIVLFLLPPASTNDVYNENKNPKSLVKAVLTRLPRQGAGYTIKCFAGYTIRKLWSEDVPEAQDPIVTGPNLRALVTDGKGFSGTFYRNVSPSRATEDWRNELAVLDYEGHSSYDFLGWYHPKRRTFGQGPTFGELFDFTRHFAISARPLPISTPQVRLPSNLDDVLLAILVGCKASQRPQQEMCEAGVDVVISFKGQYTLPRHSYFTELFLKLAYQKSNNKYQPYWDNYPTVAEAETAAIAWLKYATNDATGTEVANDVQFTGAKGATSAKSMKLYPPRYGAKDK